MTDKNIQMTQRNAANNGWDNLFPKTKASNVAMADDTSVEDKINNLSNLSDGVWEKIAKIILGTNAALVNFTSLSGYKKFKLNGKSLQSTTTTNRVVYLRYNNDSGGNYSHSVCKYIYPTFSQEYVGSGRAFNVITKLTADGSVGKTAFEIEIKVFGNNAIFMGLASHIQNDGTDIISYSSNGLYKGSALIDSISLLTDADMFKTGCEFELWGVK